MTFSVHVNRVAENYVWFDLFWGIILMGGTQVLNHRDFENFLKRVNPDRLVVSEAQALVFLGLTDFDLRRLPYHVAN